MFARKNFAFRAKRTSQFTFEHLESRMLLTGPGEGGTDDKTPAVALTRFGSAQELEQYLLGQALDRYGQLFGQPGWPGFWFLTDLDVALGAPTARTGLEAASPDHSDTNTQVAGVDEADLVETDGNYLYILSGQQLVIADAWPTEELSVASRWTIDGQPLGQYLNGDRLTVISYTYDDIYGPTPIEPLPLVRPMIDAIYPISEPRMMVTILDITDRTAPRLVQETRIDGSYLDSRAIGNFVYVVTSDPFGLPTPELHCATRDDGTEPPKPIEPNVDFARGGPIWFPPDSSCVYETREQYLGRIEGQILSLALPHFSSVDTSGQVVKEGLVSEPTDIFKPILPDDSNLLSVVVFDVTSNDPGPVSSTSVPATYSTELYASAHSLYRINPDWGWGWSGQPATSIFKFDIDPTGGKVDLAAVGDVPGRILNSFSIDEYDNHLRIATTQGWGPESDNRVFVLKESGDQLEVVGRTPSLAKGEQIFSVRFMEQTGYVVTFVRVDPLFALDLSDPMNPRVMGELHIPGFSNYMQLVRKGLLLGIGNDADEAGRVKGLQISLFDVTDLASPKLADRFSFDLPPWSRTEATNDHHAVGYYPEYNVVAIPVTNGNGWVSIDRDGDGAAEIQTYRPQTDLWVFQLDMPSDPGAEPKAAGIKLLGRIQHDTDVRRSVRIEDLLYSVSYNSVKVNKLLNPETELGQLHFGQEDVGVPIFVADVDEPLVAIAVQQPERVAPQVLDVSLGSTQWDGQFVDYLDVDADALPSLDVLPFGGINQIKATFNEDVIVGWYDLVIRGVKGDTNSVVNFSYDADTATAIWTLASPLEAGNVTVQLKDTVVDLAGSRLDGNANGRGGGNFNYAFRILPGDVNADGRVDRGDVTSALAFTGSRLGDASYLLSYDVDGNGQIDNDDVMAIGQRTGTALPGSVDGNFVPGDANGDRRFNQLDIVKVLQSAKYLKDEPADWSEGDWNGDGRFDQLDLIAALQQGHYSVAGREPEEAVDNHFAELADARVP
jgi:uncharacterized secreted protein with C-terminal beta-propeller domain